MEGPSRQHLREQWLKTKDVQVRRNKTAFPRAWIVHSARLLPRSKPNDDATRNILWSRLIRTEGSSLSPGELAAPNLRMTAYVETEHPEQLAGYLPGMASDTAEFVTVRYDDPACVRLETHLQKPGLVILADAFDSGWRLTIDGSPAPILRANWLMRGAAVSSGTHVLVFTFEPASVWLGGMISLISLPALTILAIWARFRPVSATLV